MPRSLPAALQAAMDSGSYDVYLKCLVTPDTAGHAVALDVLSFTLADTEAECVVPYGSAALQAAAFALERGVILNGAPVTIRSCYFWIYSMLAGPKGIELKGHILPPGFYSYPNNPQISYEDMISRMVGYLGFSFDQFTEYEDWSAPWMSNYFYPPGREITLSNMQDFINLCAQKFFIFFADGFYDEVNNAHVVIQATTARAKDYDITDELLIHEVLVTRRRLIWRDELYTTHVSGVSGNPYYNLGFLDSNGVPPANVASPKEFKSSKLPVHLKYQTGDCVKIGTAESYFEGRIKVTEVFDRKSNPSWHVIIEPLVWFHNTEGGNLPSTVMRAAPYTPLYTGHFNGVLGAADNNLQAAMETLDDHNHGGANEVPNNENDMLVGHFYNSVWYWARKTLAEIKTILGLGSAAYTAAADYAVAAKGVTNGDSHNHAGGDGADLLHSNLMGLENNDHPQYELVSHLVTAYAPIAKGVTNGDSHNHLGGDGGQVDHADLANIGTNTHAQIDTYVNAAVARFVPLTTPLTSASWAGSVYSTTAKTTLDLSAVFSMPANVKAVYATVTIKDSGSAGGDYYFILAPPGLGGGIGQTLRCSGLPNSTYTTGNLLVPCDANGDVAYQVAASGTNSMTITIRFFGYWI